MSTARLQIRNMLLLNFEKYRNQTGLYYQQPEEDAITFQDEAITIPAGELYGVSGLTLDLNTLAGRYADYVIPLEIANTSDGSGIQQGVAAHGVEKQLLGELYRRDRRVQNQSKWVERHGEQADRGRKIALCPLGATYYFYAGQFDRASVERDQFIVDVTQLDRPVLRARALFQ